MAFVLVGFGRLLIASSSPSHPCCVAWPSQRRMMEFILSIWTSFFHFFFLIPGTCLFPIRTVACLFAPILRSCVPISITPAHFSYYEFVFSVLRLQFFLLFVPTAAPLCFVQAGKIRPSSRWLGLPGHRPLPGTSSPSPPPTPSTSTPPRRRCRAGATP